MTDMKNGNRWACFDAQCSLCANLARRVGPFLRRHRFGLAPLQTEWVKDRLATVFRYLRPERRVNLGRLLAYVLLWPGTVDRHPLMFPMPVWFHQVFNAVGDTIAVVTVRESQIGPLTSNELLHVRPLSEAAK